MKQLKIFITIPLIMLSLATLAACTANEKATNSNKNKTDDATLVDSLNRAINLFNTDSTEIEKSLVPCTLSGGLETSCFKIKVTAMQTDHKMGPWCPSNINDTKDKAGIWLDNGNVYDADGNFMENLAAFYKDDEWQLYDKVTGNINVTNSKEACAAAARPDVDPKYQNHCVQCLPSYTEVKQTYLIPANPVKSTSSQRINPRSGVGLAFNGTKFDASAPVDAILGAHTIAPFDDCGGHVNLHVGYHYHAAMGCSKEVADTVASHANMIGYAMDGFPLHSRLNTDGKEPTDLDECRGHEIKGIGYHYHANDPGKNEILGCFKAETGCAVNGDSQSCVNTGRRGPPSGIKKQ